MILFSLYKHLSTLIHSTGQGQGGMDEGRGGQERTREGERGGGGGRGVEEGWIFFYGIFGVEGIATYAINGQILIIS